MLKIPLFFSLQEKVHSVFHMNIQVKGFEVWMSQVCVEDDLEKYTHMYAVINQVIHQDNMTL